ncbi:MAG: hypothetical protein RTV31_00280 [Candidatus Thorarchaeota archaeon]
MSEEEVGQIIDDYIKKTSRLLPDNFETEDLLDDLKSHIYEGLGYKQELRPSESSVILVQEVLKELGTPEEIAEEYGRERVPDSDDEGEEDKFEYYAIRLIAAIIVAVIAGLIVDFLTEGVVDFALAFFVIVAFAVIEWFVRAKQVGES